MLVIDDLQWADTSTLDALAYLVAGFADQRLLVLATCRDEDRPEGHRLHGWLADMRRMPGVRELHLARLDVGETEEQLASLLGTSPSVTLTHQVHDRTRSGRPVTAERAPGCRPRSAS